jgi:hypothetical protein
MLASVDTIVLVSLSEVFNSTFVVVNCLADGFENVPAVAEMVGMRPKRRIPLKAVSSIVVRDRRDETVLLNKCLAFRDDLGRGPEVFRGGRGSGSGSGLGTSGHRDGRKSSFGVYTSLLEIGFLGSDCME